MNTLLFFAELQESMGQEQIHMEAEGKTVEEMKEIIHKIYTLPRIEHAMVAINEEFVPKDTVIKDKDIIAFIPPVSGG